MRSLHRKLWFLSVPLLALAMLPVVVWGLICIAYVAVERAFKEAVADYREWLRDAAITNGKEKP